MDTKDSYWRYDSPDSLLHAVSLLSRTSGVYEITITPRRVRYRHDVDLDLAALQFPDEPALWRAKLGQLVLRSYKARSLRECVVFGWEQLRGLGRFGTHICVWDRDGFYHELFGPRAFWTEMPRYFDDVYGLDVIDTGQDGTLPKGRVVLCGGRKLRGTVDDADTGLVLERG